MELIESTKEVAKKNKIIAFFTLGGIITAAAMDAGLMSHSTDLFTNSFAQAMAGIFVARVASINIFSKNTLTPEDKIEEKIANKVDAKNQVEKEDLTITNKERNTFSCSALLCLGAYYINDFLAANIPLAETARNLQHVAGYGSGYLAAATLTTIALKSLEKKNKI